MKSPARWIAALALASSAFSLVAAQDAPAGGDKPAGETPAPAAGEGRPEGEIDPSEAPALRVLNKKWVTEDLKQCVRKGLKRLSELQQPNGSFTKGGGENVGIAVSSLAGLALVASGSTPDKGPYANHVRKCMEYLLTCQDPNNGYFTGANDGSRIHGHGYATLFMTQILGTLKTPAERAKLEKSIQLAVKCIEAGQTAFGGWGYVPDDLTWDEGSTTVCCIQALRAASDAGINVNMKTIQNAIKYMVDTADQRTFVHDGVEYKGYTFKYSLASGWNSDSYALCAAAIATMNGIGVYAEGAVWKEHEVGKIYKGGLAWLRFKFDEFNQRRRSGVGSLDVSHFYYANFYAVQAMWNAPEEAFFDEYFPKIRDLLMDEQKRNSAGNGGWASQSYGEAYTTANALMILQVPYQLLPLFAK
ncbi:MAG: terpene cyclase/mutase family protein [Planctomycetes bacterium]|nr:terpene cyclase/mutase family protein [Planctomycetota bacterium]